MKKTFSLNELIVFIGEVKGINMFDREGLEMLRSIQEILIMIEKENAK